MTYIRPIRRATALRLPLPSVARSRSTNDSAAARSWGSSTLTRQSNARPSLCSLRPPTLQLRTMPDVPVPAYRLISHRCSSTAPLLGDGEQVVWPW